MSGGCGVSEGNGRPTLRVGIVGLGIAGSSMVPALQKHPNVRLTAVSTRNEERGRKFAEDFPVEVYPGIEELCESESVDAVYVGPADLSLSLGLPPGNNDDRSEFTEALEAIVAGCRRHGVVPGIHASGALAERRLEQGFLMVTVSNDLLSMRTRMAEELAQAKGAAEVPRVAPTAKAVLADTVRRMSIESILPYTPTKRLDSRRRSSRTDRCV